MTNVRTSPEVEALIIADIQSGLGRTEIQRKHGVGGSTYCRIKALATANRNTKFDLLPSRMIGKVTTQVNASGDIERHWIRHHDAGQSIEETVAHIQKLFDGFEPIRVTVPAPAYHDDDLLTLYPIADAHMGMMAWGKETGENYNLDIASKRIIDWLGQCVAASPASGKAIILDVGDLTHGDDQTNQTPQSKHNLDMDTRHFKTIEATIITMAAAVELALAKHAEVVVRILPGNHNPNSYLAIMFALHERYRDEPRVKVQKIPGELFVHQFGKVLLSAHHGDKAKAERLVMFLADQYPELWGATRHRFLFTGHRHHSLIGDIGGVKVEQLRAVTAKDAYAVSHAYSARAELQAICYHRERGEIQRVRVTA